MVLLIAVILCYVGLIILFIVSTKKVKVLPNYDSQPEICFSIVVPFRNEAANLPSLLKSIEKLKYPVENFEVILVDDESEDNFQLPTSNFQIKLIPNQRTSNSPKKDAIQTAISQAKYDWILTTDADCVVTENWLVDLNQFIQTHQKEMVCGPVLFKQTKGFLQDFQQIELLSLQEVTIGSFGLHQPFMCNGANFAYTKTLYKKLNGFEGNDTIASGDDVFLLQKAIKYHPEKVGFLKKSGYFVQTNAASSWKELFYQRVRWAGKSTNYSSRFGQLVALVVLLGNSALIAIIFEFFFGHFEYTPLLLLKVAADYILAKQAAQFYQVRLNNVLLTAFVYPFFSSAVAFYSLFGKYQWKGRKF